MRNFDLHGNLQKQIRNFTIAFMSIAFIEHLLITILSIKRAFKNENTIYDGFRNYYLANYPEAFIFTEYSVWKGFILQVKQILFKLNLINSIILVYKCSKNIWMDFY